MADKSERCAWCEKERYSNPKRCAGCRKVWYCSKRCQTDHWKFHVFDCRRGKPIGTVYYLARDMRRDLIPVDHQTRVDYGFERARELLGAGSESELCGLYQGLIRHLEVDLRELRRWQKEGTLVEGIKRAFEAIPPQNRGAYYKWFLEHPYVLDGSRAPADNGAAMRNAEDEVHAFLRNGWPYAGGSPSDDRRTIENAVRSFPEHKQICFFFCAGLRSQRHPNPVEESWLTFGFVAGFELEISRWYVELIKCCTFEELREAYESSSIPALFARHGNTAVANNQLFSDVMSGSPRSFKSVWLLKKYVDELASSSPEKPPRAAQAVVCDYGYGNCRKPEDQKLLDELYTKLFAKGGMDPLALHAACLSGELLEFAKGFVKLSPYTATYTRLLRNPYPLPVDIVTFDGLFSYNGLFTYICYLCIHYPIMILCIAITIGLWYYY